MDSATDFDSVYGGSIPPPPANHFLDFTKMVYNLSRCEIKRHPPRTCRTVYRMTGVFPTRKRDGTCIRVLLANRREHRPSNRKASGFLKLLDVIESDLGGKPPHAEVLKRKFWCFLPMLEWWNWHTRRT